MTKASLILSAQVVLDVGDIERAATFWGALLDQEPSPPRANGQYVTVGALADTIWLVLQCVPEGKTIKNRVHLDFTVADVDAAVQRILALGGKIIREVHEGGGHFVTMADPDGNEFCLAAYARSRTGERQPAISPPDNSQT
ncbi:MAG: VOC family protein [Candidatus Tectomicrobia bacterium]|nr:VOC family protein [Candidatus Tectomicrobia bacterium]